MAEILDYNAESSSNKCRGAAPSPWHKTKNQILVVVLVESVGRWTDGRETFCQDSEQLQSLSISQQKESSTSRSCACLKSWYFSQPRIYILGKHESKALCSLVARLS